MTTQTVNNQAYNMVQTLYSSSNGWLPVPTNTLRYSSTIYKDWKATVRRVRPVIPDLSPTEHITGSAEVVAGNISYKTKTYAWCGGGNRYYTVKDSFWIPATGSWDLPPGSNTYEAILNGTYRIPIVSVDAFNLAANDLLANLNYDAISLALTAVEAGESAAWLSKRGMHVVQIVGALTKRSWPQFRQAVKAAWQSAPPHQARFKRFPVPPGPAGQMPSGPRVSAKMPKRPPNAWQRADAKASDLWLEYRYAVTPLIAEAYAYGQWLAGLWEDYESMTKVHGKYFRWYSGSFDIKPYFWPSACGGSPGTSPSGVMDWEARIADKRLAFYRVADIEKRMRSTLGLNLSDVPAAIWERMPLSFVGDWGWTFGDYLNLLKADIGLQYVTGYHSTTLDAWSVDVSVKRGDALDFSHELPSFKRRRYWRRIDVGAPKPMVVVRSAFNSKRQGDAAALLLGLRKKIQHIK